MRKKKRFLYSFVSSTLVILIMCSVVFMTSSLTASADDDGDEYSFYRIASAAGSYYEISHRGNHDDDQQYYDADLHDFQIGAVLGFVDKDYNEFNSNIRSSSSKSSQTLSYDALGKDSAADAYAHYGSALRQLGLDSTSTPQSSSPARIAIGLCVGAAYELARVAGWAMSLVSKFLQAFNPFSFFNYEATYSSGVNNFLSKGHSGAKSTFVQYLGNLYYRASEFGHTFSIPVFFAVMIGSIFLGRKYLDHEKTMSEIRKYLTRVLVIIIAVPVMGTLYTNALDALGESSGSGQEALANVIFSTFVDFEAWATHSQLALPSGTTIVVDKDNARGAGQVNENSSTPVRELALLINRQNGAHVPYTGSGGFNYVSMSASDLGNWSDDPMHSNKYDAAGTYDYVLSLLQRYMSGSYYQSSSYETQWKSLNLDYANTGVYQDSKKEFEDFASNFSDENSYFQDTCTINENELSRGGGWIADAHFKVFYGGRTMNPAVTSSSITYTGFGAQATYGNQSTYLSPMSMYNYLSTKFGDGEVTVFSSEKGTNHQTIEAHSSVNLVGSNSMMKLAYALDSCVILFTLIIIGWGYALAMLVGSVKRSIKAMLYIPATVMGSLRSGAYFISNVIMLIVEIMGTLALYNMVSYLLIYIHSFFIDTLADAVTGLGNWLGSGGATPSTVVPMSATIPAVGPAGISVLVFLILNAVVMIWFSIVAIKSRKTFLTSIEQYLDSLLSQILMAQIQPSGSSGGGGGAVGKGLGMAAAAGAAGGGSSGGSSGSGGGLKSVVGNAGKGLAMGAGAGVAFNAMSGGKGAMGTAAASGAAQNASGTKDLGQNDSGQGIMNASAQSVDDNSSIYGGSKSQTFSSMDSDMQAGESIMNSGATSLGSVDSEGNRITDASQGDNISSVQSDNSAFSNNNSRSSSNTAGAKSLNSEVSGSANAAADGGASIKNISSGESVTAQSGGVNEAASKSDAKSSAGNTTAGITSKNGSGSSVRGVSAGAAGASVKGGSKSGAKGAGGHSNSSGDSSKSTSSGGVRNVSASSVQNVGGAQGSNVSTGGNSNTMSVAAANSSNVGDAYGDSVSSTNDVSSVSSSYAAGSYSATNNVSSDISSAVNKADSSRSVSASNVSTQNVHSSAHNTQGGTSNVNNGRYTSNSHSSVQNVSGGNRTQNVSNSSRVQNNRTQNVRGGQRVQNNRTQNVRGGQRVQNNRTQNVNSGSRGTTHRSSQPVKRKVTSKQVGPSNHDTLV